MDSESLSVLLFNSQETRCAAEVEPVVSVTEVRELRPCSLEVSCVVGMMPHDQEWVPVVDLGARWGSGSSQSSRSFMILVRVRDQLVGFLVSECTGVVSLALDQLFSLPRVLAHSRHERCVCAVAQIDADMLIVIEWDSILTPDEQERLAIWHRTETACTA